MTINYNVTGSERKKLVQTIAFQNFRDGLNKFFAFRTRYIVVDCHGKNPPKCRFHKGFPFWCDI